MIQDFKDPIIWQKAIQAGKRIYEITKSFPPEERFGLTSQLRKAGVSISSNIAEGHARQGREFPHFISISKGSLAETESQLLFSAEIGIASLEDVRDYRALAREIHKMGASLIEKLEQANARK